MLVLMSSDLGQIYWEQKEITRILAAKTWLDTIGPGLIRNISGEKPVIHYK